MVDQGTHEYWGEKHQPFVPAWTNPDELRELADAVVRNGAKIEHKVVPDLRQLIEAVQQHADARLAEIGPDGKPTIEDPTKIEIYGGEIAACSCKQMTIHIALSARTRFVHTADFIHSSFVVSPTFGRSHFIRQPNFVGMSFHSGAFFEHAIFVCPVLFDSITFVKRVSFYSAKFHDAALFLNVTCTSGATFNNSTLLNGFVFHSGAVGSEFSCEKASFGYISGFSRTVFAGDIVLSQSQINGVMRFDDSECHGVVNLSGIVLRRQLLLSRCHFSSVARVSIEGRELLPGSVISLPEARVRSKDLQRQPNSMTWPSDACPDRDQHWYRILIWLIQYCLAIISPWIENVWPWLRKTLGIFSHGTFILHEDSHDPNKLRSAAAQYNQLRDNFRHQPSTDELEDLCHFRYMDLRRKAGDLWMQRQPKSSAAARYEPPNPIRWLQWLLFDGILYWLIWRNCLGYLVRPMRPLVTAFLVIMIGWLVYGFGANENTIHYSGALAEGVTGIQMWDKSWWTPLYFSVTTFTTLGYGDFAPTGWLRLVAGAQAILGVGLIALFTVSWGRKMIR